MTHTARTLAFLALLLVCATAAHAQTVESRFDFYARGPYRENVPRPASILRFDVGDFHTNYSQMERVLYATAQAAPDRVRVTDIGLTNEHRMMHVVAISSPENIARLEQIKANVARLADPRGLSQDEAQRLVASTPVVVWLSYTIHGNESASFEAMMQVVYQLAASEEPATLNILRNTVALVNVCANPDGHERFVTWYNSFGVGNPEPSAAEHDEPWSVYGRVNRYRFDLNRDNVATSQVETKNMQRAYLEWNPQVAVDHHGQPSQFFF
ncbi:MAG TPA: M14 family zinc carboxypeptidase, partial [Pyrinomonadaceae bacterium]|nr:M14 family zinc carboxypeptidase [Pyrinomonadaceae bacterium]